MTSNAHALRAASACAIFAYRGLSGRFGPVLAPEGGEGGGERDLVKLAKDLKEAQDKVKTFAERATVEMKNLGKMTEDTKADADKALVVMNVLSDRITGLEQKFTLRQPSGADRPRTVGQAVVDSEEYKAISARGDTWTGTVQIEVKAITSASASGSSASTALVPADRQPGIIVAPNRALVVRDLLTPGTTASGFIEYAMESVFTNKAASVAENPSAVKPQSDIGYTLVNTGVKTLAHWIPASKQILADAPQLQSIIDGRLRYGLAFVEDQQLLMGDGTGTNLLGLMPQATAYAAPSGVQVAGATMIDKLRLAMLQATLALYPATGHVLHPTDWASIELTKDSQGRYVFANPTGLAGPTLWGLPVAESLAMPQNNFLTGALKLAAQIFDREDANVKVSTEDRDNFVKNMVTILAEERLALAVYRPQALIKGTFAAAA